MHLKHIHVRNFRLLNDASLSLEAATTVVVGRNNSGKTSFTELLRRLLVETSPAFKLEDISLSALAGFWTAAQMFAENQALDQIREKLPAIEVRLTIEYGQDLADLGALAPCIIDLDPACCEAVITIRFAVVDGKIGALLSDADPPDGSEDERKRAFFRAIRGRISSTYRVSVQAEDPTDPTNRRDLDLGQLKAVLRADFISAHRGLDDTTSRERDTLGKILQTLFAAAITDSTNSKDKETAEQLRAAVESVEGQLQQHVSQHLEGLLPAFALFGYPGLADPQLTTETSLDVERLLQGHTRIRYEGLNGVNLPESYNGLGTRNLISILLQLHQFFRQFRSEPRAVGVHLIAIEEPEAHLHPQMQDVFVRQLHVISAAFNKIIGNEEQWPVQFVISTHSPHIANSAPFSAIRYFLTVTSPNSGGLRRALVKDLRADSWGQDAETRDFLHQYLTVTRCDLLFADKAILIEGTTERLMLPPMIDRLVPSSPTSRPLSSQYVSVIEVGGAYAHLFFELLEFLELPTLVITDIDSVDQKRCACLVSASVGTSNACIRAWFDGADLSPSTLISKTPDERVRGDRMLAYQIPEQDGQPCGRSFEDAFMLANKKLFGMEDLSGAQLELAAFERARQQKKSEFAVHYAVKEVEWNTPRYILEGLSWLASVPNGPADEPTESESIVASGEPENDDITA